MKDASQPRPTLVTILAILTLIGAVLTLGYQGLKEMIPELERNEVPLPSWITVVTYAMTALKVLGAILLLGMRRAGFFLYACAETVSAVMVILGGKYTLEYMDVSFVNPNLAFDPQVFAIVFIGMSIGFSILFIGGHAAHLGKMR